MRFQTAAAGGFVSEAENRKHLFTELADKTRRVEAQ
jgi:hypothetical protein